jgi:putative aldouronate transport system substrate-binding protein
MDSRAPRTSLAGPRLSRRGFLTAAAGAAGAVAAGPMLAACGQGGGATSGTTSASQVSKILPAYAPASIAGLRPDFPSVNGTPAGYLSYPSALAHSVHETPGRGGTYTGIAPYWGSIPRTNGNTYYDAVNAALGANMQWQPTNGNNIGTTLPPLFAGNRLPDWIDVPTFAEPSGFGQAIQSKLADLTPYLAGDKIKQYPNLAAISTDGWRQAIWDGKIYGIPTVVTPFSTGVMLFYRADILDKLGIGTPHVSSLSDLYDLGREINDPKAKRWAFDDIWQFMGYPYGISLAPPFVWTTDAKGDLITTYESEGMIEAMNWERKIFQAGMVHPESVAGDTSTAKQRFWSGQMVIVADGGGAWNYGDAISGKAANPGYTRAPFDFFTASGTGTPKVALSPPTEYVSYLNKDLKPAQIEELLRIANYLAAPFGSYEYTLVNYGKQDVDYTMTGTGPVLTATGNKDVANATLNLLASPDSVITNPGYPQITRANAEWDRRNVKYGFKSLFYAMNITVPNDLSNAYAFSPFTSTPNIMYQVVRGQSSIADYRSTVSEWLRNGGSQLKKFFESVRAKNGTA